MRRDVFEGFADFTGEHMSPGLFFIEREPLAQVFSCGFCGTFWGTIFIEHFGATASVTKIRVPELYSVT